MVATEIKKRRDIVLVGGMIIAVLVIGWFILQHLLAHHGAAPPKAPKISLIPATPPPPPPPPKEEKKPEPPKEQKDIKIEQPVQQAKNEPPPAEPLKMEGAAGDGPSAFASGTVTNEDLSKLHAGGSGNGGGLLNPFNSYAASVKNELQRMLSRRSELRRRQYRVEVNLWVGSDGRVQRFEMLGTTQDGDTDSAIRSVLAALPAFSEPPPAKMPQPVRLRIVAGGRA